MKNFYLMKIKNRIWNFIEEEDGIGTVEMILILVEIYTFNTNVFYV